MKNFACYITVDNLYSAAKLEHIHTGVDAECVKAKGRSGVADGFTVVDHSRIVVAVLDNIVLKTTIENDRIYKDLNDYIAFEEAKELKDALDFDGTRNPENHSQCDGHDAIRSFARYRSLSLDQWQECGGVIASQNENL